MCLAKQSETPKPTFVRAEAQEKEARLLNWAAMSGSRRLH